MFTTCSVAALVAPWIRPLSVWFALLLLSLWPVAVQAQDIPSYLPRYDLDIKIDVHQHQVAVRQRVQWTNPHELATDKLVFNVASRYTIDPKEIGLLAKLLEVLRLAPSDSFDFDGPPFQIQQALLVSAPGIVSTSGAVQPLKHFFQEDNKTALEIQLPGPINSGQSVTVDLTYTVRLPPKQGRWGQWDGITFLAQWLPVAAFYDNHGWQPAPFIPWHQPFFNEAGIYNTTVTLPSDQVLGSTGSVQHEQDLGNGWRQVRIGEIIARDFSLFCSATYHEHIGLAGPNKVRVRVLTQPKNDHYGKEMVRIACEAIPVYEGWFGPYAYPQLTIVDSPFGWNGNECGGIIMIDSRVCGFPTVAGGFVDHLLTHEICHQWFYNVVGTNGYAETWMDEGLASYFSHKLMNRKVGVNNPMLNYPDGLKWLPQIGREDYRHTGMWGTIRRGEAAPPVQPMPKFGHLITLVSMAYDRGAKVVCMMEQRLGEAAFLDFMHHIYRKYYFRILRVADFQRELEAYQGRSWEEFFHNWLYGIGMVDWAVEKVELEALGRGRSTGLHEVNGFVAALQRGNQANQPYRVVVHVKQCGNCNEPTVVGFSLKDSEECQVRVPVVPIAGVQFKNEEVCVEGSPDGVVRVEVVLPGRPTQITIDPDHILLDANPLNNTWVPRVRLQSTPLYTQLDESDLTNTYDRLNFNCGPWFYGTAYADPWYTRSALVGLRAGVYQTQQFYGGAFLAYRTDDRNIVAGFDGLVDHWPLPNTQIGFNVERSLGAFEGGNNPDASRGVLFARYVMMYSDSLYLPPFNYVEAFVGYLDRIYPAPRNPAPELGDFEHQTVAGLHYHLYYLTPYWDPEGGIAFDVSYQEGVPALGGQRESHQVMGQFSFVKTMPDWMSWTRSVPGLGWFMDSRLAMHAYGGAALPTQAPLFPLGGGTLFRGFDLAQREGNLTWVGNTEWRFPLYKGVEYEFCDRVGNVKNIYGAAFYDVGDSYLGGHELGTVAHAFGAGLRVDVAWLGLIERTMLRFDVAKTVNAATPWQFWLGIMHPF